ncbi:MAG: helix-turn-helix transcriptional regulator [Tildeniella torsiva UHER 1998/13D]|jgi:DNA-binding CsgD family transcriptional regulator|nr:helix-turn-helix transcriptional regulator [Tildeniella torsiva UHER 1998/13D]
MVLKTPLGSFTLSDTFVDLPNLAQDASLPNLLKSILVDVLGGIILIDDQDQLIYINRKALAIAKRMTQCSEGTQPIPKEIMHIIKFMRGARREFSQQNWLNQSTVFVDCLTVFNIYARWIQGDNSSYNYLLLNMEDQNQFSQNIALEEARQMGLTSREQDVWLLHQTNYTYKQIAETLNITPNTVKKHMKSILTKQRSSSAKGER